jgi:hypothetical protein
LGDQAGAIDDLKTWTQSKMIDKDLTLADITKFYDNKKKDSPEDISKDDYLSELHPTDMSASFKDLTGADWSVLQCILHFRRIETMFEGQRWYDIKRYGMTVYHHYRGANEDQIHTDSITWNDPRRVLQLPNNVIEAGYPANRDRGSFGGGGGGGYQVSPVLQNKPIQYQTK